MNKIVIINGQAGTGKDTFVELYKKYSSKRVFNLSTITEVKEIAKQMGWNGQKDDRSRKLLSDLKKLWVEYNDGIFEELKQFCYNYKSEENVIFIHCREPQEIRKFKKEFKLQCTTVLVNRNVCCPDNDSDKNVFDYEYDVEIGNDGTKEELEELIQKLVKRYEQN